MRLALILFTCALLGGGLSAQLLAKSPTKRGQWRQVSKRLRTNTDLQVTFTQQVLTLRKKIRRMQGEAYFARDGKFRWLMKEHGKQQVMQAYIYDGKTVVEHLPQDKVANVWSIGSGQVAEISRIVQLVKRLDNLERDYQVREAVGKDALLLTLTPHKTASITQIVLRIGNADSYISYLKIEYRGGRYSEYRFSQPVHKSLPATHFTFTPPVGTKVMMVN
ncbi:MAG: outer membrane lipoprotein carrier protein LolA [Pseudomonadota bacterium]|nr:outer membrane lipoprotein carrier protein LolA [Pseudomonadota bacterium]